jgi:hypothetical protein
MMTADKLTTEGTEDTEGSNAIETARTYFKTGG